MTGKIHATYIFRIDKRMLFFISERVLTIGFCSRTIVFERKFTIRHATILIVFTYLAMYVTDYNNYFLVS